MICCPDLLDLLCLLYYKTQPYTFSMGCRLFGFNLGLKIHGETLDGLTNQNASTLLVIVKSIYYRLQNNIISYLNNLP